MTLCSDGHDEVCYECRKCPVCELASTILDQKDEIDGLADDMKGLQKEIYNHKCPKEGL